MRSPDGHPECFRDPHGNKLCIACHQESQVMSPSARCSHCNALLPSDDAVCSACEPIFNLGPYGEPPDAGIYSCPHCLRHFENPSQAKWPRTARWYQPQALLPSCPHCKVLLQDRIYRHGNLSNILLIIIGSQMVARNGLPFFALLLLLLAAGAGLIREALREHRARRALPHEHRYTLYRL